MAAAADTAGRHGGQALLAGGGDVNASQGDGMTALHWAAINGDAEIADDAALRRRQRARDDAPRRLHARCTWPQGRQSRGDRGAPRARREGQCHDVNRRHAR